MTVMLWVQPPGLRVGTNPEDPKLTDIRLTSKLAALADAVTLETAPGRQFVRKEPAYWETQVTVYFNGKSLEADRLLEGRARSIVDEMQRAIHEVRR